MPVNKIECLNIVYKLNFGYTIKSLYMTKNTTLITLMLIALIGTVLIQSCNKTPVAVNSSPAVATSMYSDSVLYKKSDAKNYIVYPVTQQAGRYEAFPEGLKIDEKTGAVNVGESDAGLRYKITYTSSTGEISSSLILIAGINYLDKYYRLSAGDSIAFPVYNGDPAKALPVSSFDEWNIAAGSGCAIRTKNGQINLAQTMRNAFFGASPEKGRKEVQISYRLQDNSANALSTINVLLYYYRTMNEVPENLKQTVTDHEAMMLGINPAVTASATARVSSASAKPRPPCVIIIAN